MIITLTDFEVEVARLVGTRRVDNNQLRNRQSKYGAPNTYDHSIMRHHQGAAAEMAVAKALRVYWDMVVHYAHGLPDIQPNIEVRTTNRPNGSLIIHPEDSNDRRFYLVVGELPTYNIVGSILGGAAKQAQWWRENGVRFPAYFIPQSALNSA